jgi:hypothetical protein
MCHFEASFLLSSSERNARFVATPTGGKVELMDVYSRDSLRAFLVKLPPTLVAKESGISFDTVPYTRKPLPL